MEVIVQGLAELSIMKDLNVPCLERLHFNNRCTLFGKRFYELYRSSYTKHSSGVHCDEMVCWIVIP